MPTRKQRRRREKDFRHDVRVFEVDDEGNEVPIADLRTRSETAKPAKSAKAQAQRKGGRSSRFLKEVPPPSWERALKRGGMMGGAMLLVFLFLLKSGPLAQRLAIGIFYGIAFVPLTYLIDRTAHRSYLKRSGQAIPKTPKTPKR